MVEEQSRRIEHEITKIVDDLDKSYLRKMQVSFFLLSYFYDTVSCRLLYPV